MPADQPQWIKDHCQTVGTRIREKRLWNNLTQERLAQDADISWTTLQRMEAGATGVQISYYLRVARALGVDPGELLHGLG